MALEKGELMKRKKAVENQKEDVKKVKKTNKLDASEDGIKYIPYCDNDIAKVTSSNGALSRKFQTYDLIANFKKDLHIRGYVDYYGGYAEHTRQIIYRLDKTNKWNVKLTNIKTPVDVDVFTWQRNNQFIHNTVDEDCDFLCIGGPGWMQKKFLPENRKTYGWTMIESKRFSEECAEWIKNPDVLICPTDTDIIRAKKAGVENPVKVHLGYDELKYNPVVQQMEFGNIGDNYVFGVLGSWNTRKSIKEIIHAYCRAFDKDDKVSLLMVCKYGTRPYGERKHDKDIWNIKYEFDKIIKELDTDKKDLPHITLIDIPIHDNVLPHIMARFNCLVGFSKGESTWLPGLQAMGMKIPVIQLASECSGFMEYMNEDNSFLCRNVKYKTATPDLYKGTSEYYEGQLFAHGDVEELSEKMKLVHSMKNITAIYDMIDRAYEEVSRHWTWNNSIRRLEQVLNL